MEGIRIDVTYLLFAAFGVIGLIEWIKNLVEAVVEIIDDLKKWKALAWTLVSAMLSFVVAAAADGGTYQILTNAILILAFNEIVGYNVIVKTVLTLVKKVTGVQVGQEGGGGQ